ncbi:MAG: hypothetical protein HN572_08130 [Kordiimonadaceae bacterium]|nr:hypothetical protein [Kordiimonadaceae bacterium]
MSVGPDQILLYMLFPIAIGVLFVGRKSILLHPSALTILFIFSFITTWILVVTIGGVSSNVHPTDRTQVDELGSFESFLQIIVSVTVIGTFINTNHVAINKVLLDRVGKILVVLMSGNAVIALAAMFMDTLPITQYFISEATGKGDSQYETFSTIGRMTGIFDFPATAGIAYSLALLIWTYRIRRIRKISLIEYMFGAMIIIGGTITVSKTFLFGGLPLFLIYWLIPGRMSPRITFKLLIIILSGVVAVALFIEYWIGLKGILDIFTSDEKYASGELFLHFIQIRYGVNNQMEIAGIFPYVWEMAPFQGLGFAYLGLTDSAYLKFFMQGGLVAALLYVGFIALIIFLGAIEWYHGNEIGRLLTLIGIFVFIAGIGSPVITSSRVGVIFWVIIMLILAVRTARRVEETMHAKVLPFTEVQKILSQNKER